MKKIFLFLFLSGIFTVYTQSEKNKMQTALTAIRTKADFNSAMSSPNYYKQLLQEVHSTCAAAHPACCKAERITPFGISLFMGTGISLGVLATLAAQRILNK